MSRKSWSRWTDPRLHDVRTAFDREALRRVCQAREESFIKDYGLTVKTVPQGPGSDWYGYKDNGSNVLAVAHLDTVAEHSDRTTRFVKTEAGTVVFSRALDDRLGAYTILELLPKLGLQYDVLLTTGEEMGESTAAYFEPPAGKQYDWMIEFDRGGTDVVMYQYDDAEVRGMVRDCGATPADGIFSDISYLEHLAIKGFNWGVGYQDYHGPRAHAFLEDYYEMLCYYLEFHRQNEGTAMPHYETATAGWGRSSWSASRGLWWDDSKDPWVTGEPDHEVEPDIDAPDWNEHPSLAEVNAAVAAEVASIEVESSIAS